MPTRTDSCAQLWQIPTKQAGAAGTGQSAARTATHATGELLQVVWCRLFVATAPSVTGKNVANQMPSREGQSCKQTDKQTKGSWNYEDRSMELEAYAPGGVTEAATGMCRARRLSLHSRTARRSRRDARPAAARPNQRSGQAKHSPTRCASAVL